MVLVESPPSRRGPYPGLTSYRASLAATVWPYSLTPAPPIDAITRAWTRELAGFRSVFSLGDHGFHADLPTPGELRPLVLRCFQHRHPYHSCAAATNRWTCAWPTSRWPCAACRLGSRFLARNGPGAIRQISASPGRRDCHNYEAFLPSTNRPPSDMYRLAVSTKPAYLSLPGRRGAPGPGRQVVI